MRRHRPRTSARFGPCPTACATMRGMALRMKRSISLPPELAQDIERAAAAEGTTVSGWIARTAAHRLRLDAGRHAIAAWEADHGALTAAELADALKQARALLRKPGRARLSSRPA